MITRSGLFKLFRLMCLVLFVPLAHSEIFLVNTSDDTQFDTCDRTHCSLREAISAANSQATTGGSNHQILFDLPSSPFQIRPGSALPSLGDNVDLDGSSQKGTRCPQPEVEIRGADIDNEQANGLEIHGSNSSIRGFIISRFPGHGVVVTGDNNTLTCLYVGTDRSGSEPAGNGGHGILIAGGSGNTVGGDADRDANLLSANAGSGLFMESAPNTSFANNWIGLDVRGEAKLPNGDAELPSMVPDREVPRWAQNARFQDRLSRMYARRIAQVEAMGTRTSQLAPLLIRYQRLYRERGIEPVPRSIEELIEDLGNQKDPEIAASFIDEADALMSENQDRTAQRSNRFTRIYSRFLSEGAGRSEPNVPEDEQDLMSVAIAELNEGDFVIAEPPPNILYEVFEGSEITIAPLRFHSLKTYGPLTFNAELSDTQFISTCFFGGECFWPPAYDFLPFSAIVYWQSTTLSQAEMDAIVSNNNFYMEVRLNGTLLKVGPPSTAAGLQPGQQYSAATYNGEDCPTNARCIATTFYVRDALRHIPFPWTLEMQLHQVSDLPSPIIKGIDEFGNPIIVTQGSEMISKSARTIQANPATGHLKWFDEALVETFQHPRCVDCHAMEDFAGLAAHHGYNDVDSFVTQTQLHLEPSLYVSGAHVMRCNNCHEGLLHATNNSGQPFHEREWRAPYFDLDVNWGEKNSAQICAKVKQNLPTKSIRHTHFHGDTRLFWAVEDPKVPGATLAAAPPDTFDEFMRRVDLWNFFGAPCP